MGSTSAQVRQLGLRSLSFGAPIFVAGILFGLPWRVGWFHEARPSRGAAILVGGPMATGYSLVLIGLSRLVFGAAADSRSLLWSVVRILFGVFATISLIVVFLILMVAA